MQGSDEGLREIRKRQTKTSKYSPVLLDLHVHKAAASTSLNVEIKDEQEIPNTGRKQLIVPMLPICHEEQQRRKNYDYVGSFKYNS